MDSRGEMKRRSGIIGAFDHNLAIGERGWLKAVLFGSHAANCENELSNKAGVSGMTGGLRQVVVLRARVTFRFVQK